MESQQRELKRGLGMAKLCKISVFMFFAYPSFTYGAVGTAEHKNVKHQHAWENHMQLLNANNIRRQPFYVAARALGLRSGSEIIFLELFS